MRTNALTFGCRLAGNITEVGKAVDVTWQRHMLVGGPITIRPDEEIAILITSKITAEKRMREQGTADCITGGEEE